MQVKVLSVMTFLGLALSLGACGGQPESTTSAANSPESTPEATTPSPESTVSASQPQSDHGGHGGQVIETGQYHLELLVAKEPAGLHIDFFLQEGEAHAPVPRAQVVGQLQLPDGSQKTLDFQYSDADKHYTAYLTEAPAGEYRLVVLTDIRGEKVNGRFTFIP